ncbi:MAG: transcriptional repressor, partial [Gammaproteobacteria bacterium]|nr:transcriptional repressor [Gammaproteobacteria bacterium]
MNKNKEIRSAGLKVTHARRAILRILESEKSMHASADDIHRKLIENADEVGIATIYRVLNQFVSAGICIRHNFE